jgi:Uma2 family endonuclease
VSVRLPPEHEAAPAARGLTYDDLAAMPEPSVDGLRKELIDGELYVSPSPTVRHQLVSAALVLALGVYAREHGGRVLHAPMDVLFTHDTVIEPDVLFFTAERWAQRVDERFFDVVPDLLVEVSSPSTRWLDLVKKRNLYEREGVPEFWFVDLEADTIDVYRLDASGRYGEPTSLGAGDTLTCVAAPGFEARVDEIFTTTD